MQVQAVLMGTQADKPKTQSKHVVKKYPCQKGANRNIEHQKE